MQEIRLSDMTQAEAYELDKRLSYCATVALLEASADKHMNDSEEDISNDGIDLLASLFNKSLFAMNKDHHLEHVKERLRIELSRHIPSSDPSRQELLMPIMAYALLVSNEYNSDTVRKRITNDKKDPPQKKGKYPYNHWKHVNPYIINRSITPPKSSTFTRKLTALTDAMRCNKDYIYSNSYNITYACALLKNYPFLVSCQDLAKIALFLRHVLTATHNSEKPMNSLLRMYLANRFDNILLRSYALCNENYATAINETAPDNNLLSYYYASFEHDDSGYVINGDYDPALPYDLQHTPLNLHFTENYDNKCFTDIYKELISNYSISEKDLNFLVNFYLDHHTLSAYTDLIDNTKYFTDCIIKNISSQVTIPDNALTVSMTSLGLWIMHSRKVYPTFHINYAFKGKWRGAPLTRHLCLPRIYKCIPQESDQLSFF